MGFKDVSWNLTDSIENDKLQTMSENDELNARLARFIPQGIIGDSGPTPVSLANFTNAVLQNPVQLAVVTFDIIKNRMISVNSFVHYCFVQPQPITFGSFTQWYSPKPLFYMHMNSIISPSQTTGLFFYAAIDNDNPTPDDSANNTSGTISFSQYFVGAKDDSVDESTNLTGILPVLPTGPYTATLYVKSVFDSAAGGTSSKLWIDSNTGFGGAMRMWVVDHGADRAWEPKAYVF